MGFDRRAARIARVAVFVPLFLVATTAQAQQPTATEKETARGLMIEGRARRERNDAKGALESFRAADAIMHVPTTGFELARAQIALGQLVEARDTLRRVARDPGRDGEPKPFAEARANAQALDDDLAQRVPSLQVVLQGVPTSTQATVEIDGVAMPPEAARTPFKVNAGHHAIVARAGRSSGRAEVDVVERESKMVTVAMPAAQAEESTEQASTDAPTAESSQHPHTARTLAWIGFGVAGVGAAVGAITGLASISKTNEVKTTCIDSHCPASSAGDLDSARSMATVSTVAFAAAGVGLAVGIGALVFAPHDAPPTEPTTARATVTPWVGLGTAGVRGSF